MAGFGRSIGNDILYVDYKQSTCHKDIYTCDKNTCIGGDFNTGG